VLALEWLVGSATFQGDGPTSPRTLVLVSYVKDSLMYIPSVGTELIPSIGTELIPSVGTENIIISNNLN